MNIGDKIRVKDDFWLRHPKDSLGEIVQIDYHKETVHVRMDSMTNFIPLTFIVFDGLFEIIKREPKIPVPNSLKDWYRFTKPYMGGSNE